MTQRKATPAPAWELDRETAYGPATPRLLVPKYALAVVETIETIMREAAVVIAVQSLCHQREVVTFELDQGSKQYCACGLADFKQQHDRARD